MTLALATAFAVVLLAAIAQAVTGFGFALLAVPLLAMATDARTAVVGAGVAAMGLTFNATVRERSHVRWRAVVPLLAAMLAGMPLGLVLLARLPERALAVLIAVVVLACTLLVWRPPRLSSGPAVVGGVGFVSGVLTTATGTNGPPLVAAFQAMGYRPREFRATLAVIFAAAELLSVVGFGLSGQLTEKALLVGLVGVPAAVAGWWLGNHIFLRIDPDRFRHVLLVALVGSCAATIVQALIG